VFWLIVVIIVVFYRGCQGKKIGGAALTSHERDGGLFGSQNGTWNYKGSASLKGRPKKDSSSSSPAAAPSNAPNNQVPVAQPQPVMMPAGYGGMVVAPVAYGQGQTMLVYR
jgi:hypothetical protein